MGETSHLLQAIRRGVHDQWIVQLPDPELLQRFVVQRDEAAFLTLLQRHGPLVLSVCRALLSNAADAEDAFQATFLVFAQQARSIRQSASLAGWLYSVASRTARKARTLSARRSQHEAQAARQEARAAEDWTWREVQGVIHEELAAMSQRYREPLTLCYLQGKTLEAAAAELTMAKNTLKARLERGRAILRSRLLRRGLGSAVVLVAAWPGVAEALPAALSETTLQAVFGATVPVSVLTLKQGVLQAMFFTKLKLATVGLTALVVIGLGLGMAYSWAGNGSVEPGSKEPSISQDQKQPATEKTAKEALRYDGKDFAWWLNQLRTELKPQLQIEAIQAVGTFGIKGYPEEATAAILEAVKGHDREGGGDSMRIQQAAHEVISKMAPPAAKPLLEALKSEDRGLRRFAAYALRHFTSQENVVKALEAAVKDADSRMRQSALSGLPRDRKETLELLVHALKDEDLRVRSLAAETLGTMETRAMRAVPALKVAAKDPEPFVRQKAVGALVRFRLEPNELVPLLIQALKDEDPLVRQYAIDHLGRIGPNAKDAVPALVDAFGSTTRNERSIIAHTLGKIGPDAKEALPLLTKAAGEQDPLIKEVAAEAIKRISK
jgi:RNA polymerase sigma factor (sigma-70 family)